MDERNPCSLCSHDNPPENRFCGSCGTALADGGQLVSRLDDSPVITVRALPTKLGPTSKALAMGLAAALVTQAGLLWLRRQTDRTGRPSLPSAIQDSKPAVSEYLISRSLEEVSVWLQEGGSWSHIFARREVRSFGVKQPTGERR